MFNAVPYYDCIDVARSLGSRRRDGGIIDITKYEFILERIPPVPVFKASGDSANLFSIEDRCNQLGLQSLVELHGLKGLSFREIWNDEHGGIRF